jgi:phospholipase/carboxylesterase
MPATTHTASAEHPAEGFRSVALPSAPNRPLRVYLPTDYQPKYAYPLVVLFHGAGECEERAARLVPLLSRRNYVAACVRGPVALGRRPDGRPAFGWGEVADRGSRAALAHALASYSVHPDRVYLLGVGEGAAAAYRLAAARRVAGVVALNGTPPAGELLVAGLRMFLAHGGANPLVPPSAARAAAARLREAGATVRFTRYAASGRIHPDMLRDANHWIMAQVVGQKSRE